MKRYTIVLVLLLVAVMTASAQIVKMSELPSEREFRKAVKTLMYTPMATT